MRVQVLSYNYIKGEKEPVQGSAKNVNKFRKNGYHVVAGGNGSYWMYKKPELLLTYQVEGEENCRQSNVRTLVEDHYGPGNTTKKDLKNFYDECLAERVVLGYDDCAGLYLNNSERRF